MSAVVTPRPTRRDVSHARRQEMLWGYGLISIWLIGFLLFGVVPLASAIFISLSSWDPVAGPFWQAHFIGLANYRQMLFNDPRFWHSIGNAIIYALGTVAITNVVALPMALALNRKIHGLAIFRTIFYLPSVLPAVAATLVLRLIFQPGTGALSWLLTALHIQCDPNTITCTSVINWFDDPHLLMPAAILMSAWFVGQPMLIYLAGLQGIDQSFYEASSVDGAGTWAKFRAITIPLLTPTIFFNLIIGLIGAFQEFSKIIVLAGGESLNSGGPNDALLTTLLYVWLDAFRYHFFGYATAMAFGLFVLILIFTLANFAGQRRWVFYQEERR
ncbi:MAG TPA: sugar ABC transporter permease [Chloroflexota bacterium]|nr:sugar ABC transporter permease [Chloroflexota bacterium]